MVGAELGADFVKTVYTGSKQSFQDEANSNSLPVVIACGPKQKNDIGILKMVHGSIGAGGKGESFCRSNFQHKNHRSIVRSISLIVKKRKVGHEASEVLR
jgi:fructose-bisphosphate aldolase/2-amino-3,7-dideoxy-D-threo-hept-6-ulosonate synthase